MLYQDQLLTINTLDQPAVKGHLFIQKDGLPQNPEDFAHLLSAASFSSMTVFEQLGAHGTNIILTGDHAHVLARTENDGLDVMWKPKEFTPQELDEFAAKIKDKCDYIDAPAGKQKADETKKSQTPVPQDSSSEKKETTTPDDGKNYLIKQLDRMP